MGWFDGASEIGSTSHHKSSKHHKSSSHKASSPRASSIFGLAIPSSSPHRSHSRSRSESGRSHSKSRSHGHHKEDKAEDARDKMRSIFGTGDGGKHNSSRSSFFGGNPRASSSHYKRSARPAYYQRIYTKLRRLLRDLIYYMKRNPMKVFMLVIMPLITGGALTTLLAKFGVRLPPSVVKMFGGAQGGGGGFGGGGRRGGMEREWEHTSVSGPLGAMGGLGGLASMVGGMGGIGGAMSLAKMFM